MGATARGGRGGRGGEEGDAGDDAEEEWGYGPMYEWGDDESSAARSIVFVGLHA